MPLTWKPAVAGVFADHAGLRLPRCRPFNPEHDPEPKVSESKKWEPVFGERSYSNKESDSEGVSTKRLRYLSAA